jgi:hypothetical protein
MHGHTGGGHIGGGHLPPVHHQPHHQHQVHHQSDGVTSWDSRPRFYALATRIRSPRLAASAAGQPNGSSR